MTRPQMAHRAPHPSRQPSCPLGCPTAWPSEPYRPTDRSRPSQFELAAYVVTFAAVLAALVALVTGAPTQ